MDNFIQDDLLLMADNTDDTNLSRNGVIGASFRGYQFDAFMTPKMERKMERLIGTLRSWDSLSIIDRASWTWASAISARNVFIHNVINGVVNGVTWLDDLLRKSPI